MKKLLQNKNLIIIIIFIIAASLFTIIFFSDDIKNAFSEPKEITSIEFTDNVISLKTNETYQLEYVILPKSYIEEDINYLTDDESVATVSKEGLITAVKEGTTIITLITQTGKTATVEVIVDEDKEEVVSFKPVIDVKTVTVSPNQIGMFVGETYNCSYTISPTNATDKTLMWETDDERIATVDDDGKIIARSSGKAMITIYNKEIIKASVVVNVYAKEVDLSDIELGINSLYLGIGETYQASIRYIPSNATYGKASYSSSNSLIATVDTNGVITAIKKGFTNISVTVDGITKKMLVNVTEKSSIIDIVSLSIASNITEVQVGEQATLIVDYTPSNATNTNFTYTSSDTSVLEVSNNGTIRGIKAGNATVLVKSANNKTVSIGINVTNSSSNPTDATLVLSTSLIQLKVGQSKKISATTLPTTLNQSMTWYSSNNSVATVDANGVVTINSAGSTTIAVVNSYGKTATVKVYGTYEDVSPETTAKEYALIAEFSEEKLKQIDEHLKSYIEYAGETASGISKNRAKVLAAAYFLVYNPYSKVAYQMGGVHERVGWNKYWNSPTSDPKYTLVGLDCAGFARWAFYQVFNTYVSFGESNGATRIFSATGLTASEIVSVAVPGDVLIKNKELNNSQYGHVSIVYSVDKQKGTFTVVHAAGVSAGGIVFTTYIKSAKTSYNYVLPMTKIYGD